ncbi:glucose receptor git3 protein [Diplodia corticola]|uniref:Glucose receptor git3 protein n=1 Tax=Diplodia corticola TaxID=236234 RepID=A0A1J9RFI0_9PEZI|nr:glucose receptor git3 protein [Diplodia corticola]OJD31291.1 glucose receptor git3 protein [Diplodia corticola]
MAYNELIATVTLVGSLLSFVATSCVLISYIVYHEQQRSFRHALVLNLALAEFINSLNNSISGIINVANHGLSPSPACTFNGWIGQLSVQAADFSILAIALVTVLTITRKTYMPNASLGRKAMICASVWIVPLITSTTAAGLQTMAPVSGNWCWISSSRTDLRYALGHGWRFAIMFVTIGVYVYVWWYMRQHFQMMAGTTHAEAKDSTAGLNPASSAGGSWRASFTATLRRKSNGSGLLVTTKEKIMGSRKGSAASYDDDDDYDDVDVDDDYRKDQLQLEYVRMTTQKGQTHNVLGFDANPNFTFAARAKPADVEEQAVAPDAAVRDDWPLPPPDRVHHRDERTRSSDAHRPSHPHAAASLPSPTISTFAAAQSHQVAREIRRMLLLNAYPTMWVLLWLPGMVNRLIEASGHDSKTLAVLQSSSQYVGFANALTYGFNEHMRGEIRGDVGRRVRRWIRWR